MGEVLLPTWIVPEEEGHEWLDEGSSVFQAAFAPGYAQRQSYGGIRLKLSRRHSVRQQEMAQLLTILARTQGRFNALRTKVHFPVRGSPSSTEMLSNTTFENGTTGWVASSTAAISVADRTLRVTRTISDGTNAAQVIVSSALSTLTQYAPYVARAFVRRGRGIAAPAVAVGTTSGGAEFGFAANARGGMISHAFVPRTVAAVYVSVGDGLSSGSIAGDYIEVDLITLTRCFLVDNAPNYLQRSDELNNAYWTATRSSVSANAAVAPDGSTTAESLIEDSTASNTHLLSLTSAVTVDSSAQDYSFTIAVKAGTRTWVAIAITEQTAGSAISVYLNLADGSLGTIATGANWSNTRAVSTSLGNGWFALSVTGRKTNAATALNTIIFMATADNTATYSGNGTGNILLWRATLAQSSVPTRLSQTTSAAVTTGTSQSGSGVYVKGLPASTDGLLVAGDWFEINGELKQATASLSSDSAGRGFLECDPPIVRAPSDNDPVVVTAPTGKFLASNIRHENLFGLQTVTSYDLEHIYE